MNLDRKLAFSIPDACSATGFGKTSLYEAIGRKELRALKMGTRTFIMADDLKAWLKSQPEAQVAYTRK